ncbi:MAG: 50S ribosome-binding GTPase [Planctomycetota bacterium]|nr:50S ribosome-binding GTPase [Planctomycetota bacterium]
MYPVAADTIVAFSSALPRAGAAGAPCRAIVRLSGPEARRIAAAVFAGAAENLESAGRARLVGRVAWRGRNLPACAYVMPGPRSYTRQDVVELHLPALAVCLPEILDRLLAAGARAALPGEFTRRALLAGRLSLERAAAVGELVRAERADEAREHAARAAGAATGAAGALRDELLALLARLELGLDFSHEDVEFLPQPELHGRARELARRARELADAAPRETFSQALDGCRAALCGPVNAGKSSLFNALLGRAAALVSPEAHTTRDPVEATLDFEDGTSVRLYDTAGLADPGGGAGLLRMALDATARTLQRAELLVLALDSSRHGLDEGEIEALAGMLAGHEGTSRLLVWTKTDLGTATQAAEGGLNRIPERLCNLLIKQDLYTISSSSISGAGVPEIRAWLYREALARGGRVAAARLGLAAQRREALTRAAEALDRGVEALEAGLGEDAATVELREAVHELSACEGVLLRHDALTESLLDRIFADFCIGK